MYRTEIIQRIIDQMDAKTYLEIGVCSGKNFHDIKCEVKIGVDPISPNDKFVVPILNKNVIYKQSTSDDFFRDNHNQLSNLLIDVCFIDGLHTAEQSLKDFNNVRKYMSKRGVVVFHDCLPDNEEMQKVPQIQKQWTGDVWKAFYSIFAYYAGNAPENTRSPFIINSDYGCGVVFNSFRIKKDIPLYKYLTWNDFVNNCKQWMDIVSPEEFVGISNGV